MIFYNEHKKLLTLLLYFAAHNTLQCKKPRVVLANILMQSENNAYAINIPVKFT